jgi:hypothetical protein
LTKFFLKIFKSIFDFRNIKVEFYKQDYAHYIRIRGKGLLKEGYPRQGGVLYIEGVRKAITIVKNMYCNSNGMHIFVM